MKFSKKHFNYFKIFLKIHPIGRKWPNKSYELSSRIWIVFNIFSVSNTPLSLSLCCNICLLSILRKLERNNGHFQCIECIFKYSQYIFLIHNFNTTLLWLFFILLYCKIKIHPEIIVRVNTFFEFKTLIFVFWFNIFSFHENSFLWILRKIFPLKTRLSHSRLYVFFAWDCNLQTNW